MDKINIESAIQFGNELKAYQEIMTSILSHIWGIPETEAHNTTAEVAREARDRHNKGLLGQNYKNEG